MSRIDIASERSALRMIFPMSPLLLTMAFAPAADSAGHLPQKGDEALSVGWRPMLDQGGQVAEESAVRGLVELSAFRREPDLEASAVFGMVDPFDVSLPFELVDGPRHGAEPDTEQGRQLAH